MSVLDNAKRNYASRPRHRLEVAEWAGEDGKPVEVFFKTANPATMDAVKGDSDGRTFEMCARLICIVAEDEKGQKLFRPLDWKELVVSTDNRTLDRLAAAMMAGAAINVDEATKN